VWRTVEAIVSKGAVVAARHLERHARRIRPVADKPVRVVRWDRAVFFPVDVQVQQRFILVHFNEFVQALVEPRLSKLTFNQEVRTQSRRELVLPLQVPNNKGALHHRVGRQSWFHRLELRLFVAAFSRGRNQGIFSGGHAYFRIGHAAEPLLLEALVSQF